MPGRDDLDRRAYWRLPVWRRIAIILAGSFIAGATLGGIAFYTWLGEKLRSGPGPDSELERLNSRPMDAD